MGYYLPMIAGENKEVAAEVVFGLVGGIGVAFDKVVAELTKLLSIDYGFEVYEVRLSSLFDCIPKHKAALTGIPKRSFEYYNRAINVGNEIRETQGLDALAKLAIYEISETRKKSTSKRIAYVVHSLKRPEEMEQLRDIYGSLFYCIAVYADERVRTERLEERFSETTGGRKSELEAGNAIRLVRRDTAEPKKSGQAVRKAFQFADFFLRTDVGEEMQRSIARFLKLVLNAPYMAPNYSETAMMHAFTAALRSVDLSRQVGAALIDRNNRIVSTGCNEVPRSGGGQYANDDLNDARDFTRGVDENDKRKRSAMIEILQRLGGLFKPEFEALDAEDLLKSLELESTLSDTTVDSLIEFGRIVHAENAAVNSAAFQGRSTADADLYCTTFPCHMCARVLIDAGIRNVFYIEPYPKSVAPELYADSIVINPKLDPNEYQARLQNVRKSTDKVFFIPFDGVAPRRYSDLFRNGKRKNDDGTTELFDPRISSPRNSPKYSDTYRASEKVLADKVPSEFGFGQKVEKL